MSHLNLGGELANIEVLSAESRKALDNFRRFKSPPDTYPRIRRAAVLVVIFPSHDGASLHVILSTRALTLRTHPGQTALPGGKFDDTDDSLEFTARREAFEEIGLPIDYEKVRLLTLLSPVLAPNDLLVTPVVVYMTDISYKPKLNAHEVDCVFTHPLELFLYDKLPIALYPWLASAFTADVVDGTQSYHSSQDYSWKQRPPHRFHSFISKSGKSITGFTAAILIEVARIAYGREPDFQSKAPNSVSQSSLIRSVLSQPMFQHTIAADRAIGEVEDKLSKL